MNCAAVERWLNEGMPARGLATARAHAAGCPLCAPRLAAAVRAESILAETARGTPPAPAGFADRVLARIGAEAPLRPPAVARTAPAAMRIPRGAAWWIRAGADPAIAVAIAVATVFLGVTQVAVFLARRPIALPPPALDWSAAREALGGTPLAQAALAVSAVGLVLLATRRAYHHFAERSLGTIRRRW